MIIQIHMHLSLLITAESVNETIKTNSQQVRLYVTENDETLRIENK